MGKGQGLAGQAGFTLVEIVVSLLIFVLGILPVLSMFGQATFSSKRNQDYLSALHMCNSALEGLMLLPAAAIENGSPVPLDRSFTDPSDPDNSVYISSTETHNASVFTCRLSVTNVSSVTDPANPALSFKAAYDPGGNQTVVSAFKRFKRYDFKVTWVCRLTSETRNIELTAYKADLR